MLFRYGHVALFMGLGILLSQHFRPEYLQVMVGVSSFFAFFSAITIAICLGSEAMTPYFKAAIPLALALGGLCLGIVWNVVTDLGSLVLTSLLMAGVGLLGLAVLINAAQRSLAYFQRGQSRVLEAEFTALADEAPSQIPTPTPRLEQAATSSRAKR